MSTNISTIDPLIEFPSIENFVSSKRVRMSGKRIGKERTGYSVPFELAFEIIAAIIVDEIAIPIFPNRKAIAKRAIFFMIKEEKV